MIDADRCGSAKKRGKGKGRKEGKKRRKEAEVNERKTQIRTPEPFREKMSAADSDAALSECSRRRM